MCSISRKDEMIVYWIHSPECTDIYDGYVGVTVDLKKRLIDHKTRIKRGKHDNPHLVRASQKYPAVVDIIFEGTEEECLVLERYLRPVKQVGWNIAEGGNKPPAQWGNSNMKGAKRPDRSAFMHELRAKGLVVCGVNKNRSWWNNGIKNKMSHDCPGRDWVKGRIGNLGGPKRCAVS